MVDVEIKDLILRIDPSTLPDFIEAAIERLDYLQTDSDLEDDDPDYCLAGDDGMHPIYVNQIKYWGSNLA